MSDKKTEPQGKICHIFDIEDTSSVKKNFRYKIVEKYGAECSGHNLYTWDDGQRFLVQCEECGAYVLVQISDYHSFSGSYDSHYTDYFAVSGPEEARKLNKKYDGFAIEREFKGPHIFITEHI